MTKTTQMKNYAKFYEKNADENNTDQRLRKRVQLIDWKDLKYI